MCLLMAVFHETSKESQTPVERLSVCTQTEAPGTADAHLNTDVNDADLEYFAEVGAEDRAQCVQEER